MLALEYYKIRVSEGSVRNFIKEAAVKLRILGFEDQIKKYLQKIPHVLHYDETGINIKKNLYWAHIVCTDKVTYVYPHKKRGLEGILGGGILQDVDPNTVIVHDCWSSYFTAAACQHSLCGAHIARDLVKAYYHEYLPWSQSMLNLLINTNEYKLTTGTLTAKEYEAISKKYDEILKKGKIKLKNTTKHMDKKLRILKNSLND